MNNIPNESHGGRDVSPKRPGTALKSATRAFEKPPIAPKPDLARLNDTKNGALLAASRSWAINSTAYSRNQVSSEASRPASTSVLPAAVLTSNSSRDSLSEINPSSYEEAHGDASSRLRDELARLKTRETYLSKHVKPPPPAPRRMGMQDSKLSNITETASAIQRGMSQSRESASIKDLATTKKPSMSPHRIDRYKDHSIRMLSPHVTGESLANAIVGAHLAISRSPPRQISPAPISSSNRSKSKSRNSARSRTSSPRKGPVPMRATLRSSESSESSDSGHHYRPKRHAHKHHEGERKKWLDRITDDEIKRYSGWWAANRGLYVPIICPQSQGTSFSQADIESAYRPEEEVVSIVVRELWKRSRLPNNNLSDIWNLVDDRKIGSLSKEQFLVGVWLIDQKLKGHKLPSFIAHSVWQSVKKHNGVDVKIRVT